MMIVVVIVYVYSSHVCIFTLPWGGCLFATANLVIHTTTVVVVTYNVLRARFSAAY